MQNTAVYAPITFEEIVIVMINSLIIDLSLLQQHIKGFIVESLIPLVFCQNFYNRSKSSLSVAKAIPMINRTAELCFTNNFIQAMKELEPW